MKRRVDIYSLEMLEARPQISELVEVFREEKLKREWRTKSMRPQ